MDPQHCLKLLGRLVYVLWVELYWTQTKITHTFISPRTNIPPPPTAVHGKTANFGHFKEDNASYGLLWFKYSLEWPASPCQTMVSTRSSHEVLTSLHRDKEHITHRTQSNNLCVYKVSCDRNMRHDLSVFLGPFCFFLGAFSCTVRNLVHSIHCTVYRVPKGIYWKTLPHNPNAVSVLNMYLRIGKMGPRYSKIFSISVSL